MLLPVLVVVGLHWSYGLVQQPSQSGVFNFRAYCTSQHQRSKYSVSCDGSSNFNNKNLLLDSKSTSGLTDIKLQSFESVTIVSNTSSDWDHVQTITIRNCKKVTFNFQSTLKLNDLDIGSVEELTLETNQSAYTVNARMILLSSVGKLNLTYFKNAEIKANTITFNNSKDVNCYGDLQLSGESLTITQSNIDISEHSMLLLKFLSITVDQSSKLYVQGSGQLNVSTVNFLIQESYIFMDGEVNITSFEHLGNRQVIRFLNNSFYGMRKSHLHIMGDRSDIEFIENGIYRSDISDVLHFVCETEGVTFIKNHLGCNKCAKGQMLQAKWLQHLEQNYCESTCNLTLATYKDLLDQGQICNQGETQVDDKILCSEHKKKTIDTKSGSVFFWWIVILVMVVLFFCLSTLLYFYCKRHSPRFRSMPVEPKLQKGEENQKVILRAFNNEIYDQVDSNPDNIYDGVDSNPENIYDRVDSNPENFYEIVNSHGIRT